jgi:DNA-binding response OmpR family regulator
MLFGVLLSPARGVAMNKSVRSILVVDDDDEVLDTIRQVLVDTGFHVETAATGSEALDMIERQDFDLMVADIKLPGLTGTELARRARRFQPTLKCLFISGQGEPVVCDPELDDFVAKPFRPFELLGCVWKVLQGNFPNPRIDIARS